MHPSPPRIVLAVLILLPLSLAGCGGAKKPEPVEHDTTYYTRLAQSLANAGRVSEALAHLDEAIVRDPDNPGLHNYYGQVCLRAGRHALAEPALRRALEIDPYLTDAHNNLGVLYMESQRLAEAEREFLLALEDPGYPTPEKVHLNLGHLYDAQGRAEQAETAYRRSVEISPKYYDAHYALATLLEITGNLAEAVREYGVAEPGYRSNGQYWYRRGMSSYRLGEPQQARECLIRVRTVAPGSEWAAKADELLEVMN